MRNLVLAFMLFFLSGCSLNHLFLSEEVDKVNVVKYHTYFKHHRAYFKRDNLKAVTKNHKYLFLYHAKKQELSILLHRRNTYILYNFTNPKSKNLTLNTKKDLRYKKLLKHFSRIGYKPANLTQLGYGAKIALRRYKGVKTLMFEIKDYRHLKKRYEKAIATYQSKDIMSIKTHLPKKFIYPYFTKYKDKADTPEQLTQLQYIADKLYFQNEHIDIPEKDLGEDIYNPYTDNTKGYDYYLNRASVNELQRYLLKSNTRASLSYTEYQVLEVHLNHTKEEELLNEGSLEALIAAYKVNKNPKYKKRIMTLMKETQDKQ